MGMFLLQKFTGVFVMFCFGVLVCFFVKSTVWMFSLPKSPVVLVYCVLSFLKRDI